MAGSQGRPQPGPLGQGKRESGSGEGSTHLGAMADAPRQGARPQATVSAGTGKGSGYGDLLSRPTTARARAIRRRGQPL